MAFKIYGIPAGTCERGVNTPPEKKCGWGVEISNVQGGGGKRVITLFQMNL